MIRRRIEQPSSISFVAAEQAPAANFAADFPCVPLWKRLLDTCCLVTALPILLPMMSLIAIVIKVGSKGPVLFKQERVGFLGKRFIIFKFRTMIQGADTAVHEAHVASLIENNGPMTKLDARGDSRLIPFGRMLRAAGLDELPQLINVLRGEMSIVGPRPCLPSEYERFLPWQRERFRARPGLTGLWQVSGKNRTTFNQMMDFDIQYTRMQSLWLDLKIILKTIPAVMVEVKQTKRRATPSYLAPLERSNPRGQSAPRGEATPIAAPSRQHTGQLKAKPIISRVKGRNRFLDRMPVSQLPDST